jgi:cytochrome c-type biogenesis protein CcmH
MRYKSLENLRRAQKRSSQTATLKPLMVVVCLAVAGWHAMSGSLAAQQVYSPEVRKISESLSCRCGCSYQPLSACNMIDCPSAIPLRQEIAGQLKQGKTQAEIIRDLVSKYGKSILSAPPSQGFDLAAWIMPFAALSLGLIAVYFVIKSWLRRKPVLSAPNATVASVPSEYRQRMEKELKDFE